MKDLELPEISDKERQNIWENLKPNDKIVGIQRSGWSGESYYIGYHTIIKRTPKGSIRLENGELLKYFPSNYYIMTDELKEWMRKIKLEESLMNLLYELDRDKKYFKDNLTYEDTIKLTEILERTVNKSN